MARGVRDIDIGYPRLNEERNEAIVAMEVTLKEKFNDLSRQFDEPVEELKKVRLGVEIMLGEEL